tara:strand:+ start:2909 stop:3661 length:753 start_codon:yes stop_codon:yes gene_type:complete
VFKSYSDIYDKRGAMYHEAMDRWPDARKCEFEALVETARIEKAHPLILDVPSGGGYLSAYLTDGAKLVSIDPAPNFLKSGTHESDHQVICAPHEAIPLPDDSADAILSLAGMHHIDDQVGVFQEWFRLLRSGGALTIGDAEEGSATAEFLDGVVGRFNSMGHQGKYLRAEQLEMLGAIGFTVTFAAIKSYGWQFEDRSQMFEYCRTLFCMDSNPSDEDLLQAIEQTVGFKELDGSCALNWALYFIRAVKP